MSAATTGINPCAEIQASPFADCHDHLLAELDRLKLMLHREIVRMRSENLLTDNQFRGLYVADEQVDAILHAPSSGPIGSTQLHADVRILPNAELKSLDMRIAEFEERLETQRAASRAVGLYLPLEHLTELYGLSDFGRDALLLAIAPEIEAHFGMLYSYAQNDVTRKRPTAELILRLLCDDPAGRIRMRWLFSENSLLLHAPLVRFSDDAADKDVALLSRPIRSEERIISFLLRQKDIDDRLKPFARLITSERSLSSLHFSELLSQPLLYASRALREDGGVLFFHGVSGTGKCAAAEALSAEAGRSLLIADMRAAGASPGTLASTLRLLEREAILCDANLHLKHAEVLLGEDGAHSHTPELLSASLGALVGSAGRIVSVASESKWPVIESAMCCAWTQVEFPIPDFQSRTCLWEESIKAACGNSAQEAAATLANQFVLTGGQILGAGRIARTHVLLRGDDVSTLTIADYEAAARAQSNQAIGKRAQKVAAIHDWRDLVLPPRTQKQLQEVCAAEKFRSRIFAEWGFDRRLMQRKGLNALFCGQSGTGKTMSAGIVARELGLDLYKIDLSSVISKYIGETEKHLDQIFREAQSSNAILFFDEADAIFGKRSEVKDAHDRYANIEVSYLLQKMEEYEGIVILATNFRKNIDDAFTRRIHYVVEFPFPEAPYRERIWRSLLPSTAPLSNDIDFAFLAHQFELSGGNIRNVVLVGAIFAAQDGGIIRMEHFVLAVARELQKMGKMPSRSDFREYYEFTRERA